MVCLNLGSRAGPGVGHEPGDRPSTNQAQILDQRQPPSHRDRKGAESLRPLHP